MSTTNVVTPIQKVYLTLLGTGKIKFNDSKYISIAKVTSEQHDLTALLGKDRWVKPVVDCDSRSSQLWVAGAPVFVLNYSEPGLELTWAIGPNVEVVIELEADVSPLNLARIHPVD